MTSEGALAELLGYLKTVRYRFVAVTPATQAWVTERPPVGPAGLRDIFGWNRWFDRGDLDPRLVALLDQGDALECGGGGRLRAKVRVASLGEDLFLHSPFPTDAPDSVFFGPDTYRFARFVAEQLPRVASARWLVDMGAGSGAGAIAALRYRGFGRTTLVDVNTSALRLATINAAAAGVAVETLASDRIPDGADLVIANPPYMIDPAHRSYRDGGGLLGGAVSLDWAEQALAVMAPGGAMLLYTGAAYVEGEAPLLTALADSCAAAGAGASLELTEIDPDVFGDELAQPDYARVERIAAVGALIRTAAA